VAGLYELERLRASGLVRLVEHHGEIGSTNDRALQLAAQPEVGLPVLVLADRQMAGRGRGANRWWAAEGSITFSLAVESKAANIPARRWPQLSLTTGLAVCEALEELTGSADAQVKWPNDVYLLGRKVCGILIETPPIRDRLVIGVGLNVNNSFRTAPVELQVTASSLIDYDGQQRDLTAVLLTVLERIESCWHTLADRDFTALIDRWRSRSYLTGQTVTLNSGPQIVTGRCTGIDEEGALLLQTESELRRCHAGTILRVE
jgi:BirA family transcriptional regulator, biotin operon repressor / biotin---[acetyl-CoA-carboxylase] ligase